MRQPRSTAELREPTDQDSGSPASKGMVLANPETRNPTIGERAPRRPCAASSVRNAGYLLAGAAIFFTIAMTSLRSLSLRLEE